MASYSTSETTVDSNNIVERPALSTCLNSASDWCSAHPHDWIDQDDGDDNPAEQEQFDRISGILSQLIEEANNAIQSTSRTLEDNNTTSPDVPESTSHTMVISSSTSSRRRSRLPRPKRLSLDTTYYRDRSYSITSSTSSLSSIMDDDDFMFSPISSELATPMSRTISPLLFEKHLYSTDLDFNNQQVHPQDTLMTSFERLDSSLAIVDYLSRDLASYRRRHARSLSMDCTPPFDYGTEDPSVSKQTDYDWTLWLMLPLLYIPYLLIIALLKDEMELIGACAGVAVFVLALTILYLVCGKQVIINNHDRSKIFRRSSLPRRYSF